MEIKDNISNEFLFILEEKEKEKNDLTVDKASEISLYYLKLIFKEVKEEINVYQEEKKEKEIEDKKRKLEKYFENDPLITKGEITSVIILFIALVLFREEDKENKIKNNRKNIVNYLKGIDLWDKNMYNNEKFDKNINKIKAFNIQINQIFKIFKDIKEEDTTDIKEHIESKKKPNISEEKENSDHSERNEQSDRENDSDDNSILEEKREIVLFFLFMIL